MTPINFSLPAFAGGEAQPTEAEEASAQTDDFSALLGSLIVPCMPPPQTEQPVAAESQCVTGGEIKASLKDFPPPTSTQSLPHTYFVLHGFELNEAQYSGATGVKLNNIFEKLQAVEEKPQVEQSGMLFSDASSLTESADSEFSSQPQIDNALAQSQTRQSETPMQPILVESAKTPLKTTAWQNQPHFDLNFSTARDFPATFAATINSLRNESAAQLDNPIQSEKAGVKIDALPLTDRLSQAAISSENRERAAEDASSGWQAPVGKVDSTFNDQAAMTQTQTGTQSSASDERDKGPIVTEDAPDNPSKPGKTRSTESQFSTETAASALNVSALRASIPQSANKATTQSIATQVAHAMTQVASEALTNREPRSIRIRLRPEELGEVQINISTDAQGHLNAHISAEHDATRRALAGGLDHLREALEQAGVNIDRLNVSVNQYANAGSGRQSDAGSQQAAKQSTVAAQTSSSLAENSSDDKSSEQEDRLLSVRA